MLLCLIYEDDPAKYFIMLLMLDFRSFIKFTGMAHILKAKYIFGSLDELDLTVKCSDKTAPKINKSKG